jgi:hypothetical protein
MSHKILNTKITFVKILMMKKIMSNIDWILMLRLVMGGSMVFIGYQSNDYIPAVAGGFFIVYSIIGAKYKIGCGYNSNCGVSINKNNQFKMPSVKESEAVEFTELK